MGDRRRVPLALALLLGCSTALAACDDCYSTSYSTVQTCEQSGAFAASLAPLFNVACPPTFRWTGYQGTPSLTIEQGCPSDDYLWVSVGFPRDVTDAAYALPSAAIAIDAELSPLGGSPRNDPTARPTLRTSDGSLEIASGSVFVRSSTNYSTGAENYGIDADVDIHFRARTGEALSVTGHVVARDCTLKTVKGCYAD